jgi:hypothetical protein
MNVKKNKQVVELLDFLESKNEYFASESDKSYLRMYDACDDFHLTKNLSKRVWDYLVSQFTSLQSLKATVNPISILHTNAGTGKILAHCPSEATQITAFNNDYTCLRICDMLNQLAKSQFRYSSQINDLSHYYLLGDRGNSREHDIVFTQPVDTDYYRKIDTTKVASYDSLQYYSVRSLDFLVKGGYLCVILHPKRFNILKNNIEIFSKTKLVFTYVNKGKFDEYGCLIFKKK